MAVYVEGAHEGEFLMSEAAGTRSRETVVFGPSQELVPGQVVGQILVGALSATAEAFAGNTGNGVMGAITVDAGAPLGDYKLVITEPASNVGNFVVERPDGVVDGQGDVAAAYNGLINFTLADGATDFVAGDGFTITVVAADADDQDQYVALSLTATDGSQTPAGLTYRGVITGADETAEDVLIVRDAEVNGQLITYPTGATDDQKAAIRAALITKGIIVR